MSSNPSADTDRCARCGAAFRCGIDDAGPCPCAGVVLNAATLARLRGEFLGCLCLDCLRSADADANRAGNAVAPATDSA